MNRSASVLTLLAAAALASPLHSAVIFSTFGPGGTVSSGKYGVDGSAELQAFLFHPSAAGALDSIVVAISHGAPPSSETRFQLYSGTSSSLGTLLESFFPSNNSASIAMVTMNSTLHPNLDPSGFYWLLITEANASNDALSYWAFSPLGQFTTRITHALTGNGVIPAFQVNATDVPEPATGFSLAAATLVAVLFRRFRRWGVTPRR
jgi:hypothetical protein